MKICSLALVVYKSDDHPVLIHPHGNSKKGKQPYKRTKKSTVDLVKAELDHSSPKDATNKVFADRGGIVGARCAGDLPRDRTQTYNLKRKQKELRMMSYGGSSSHGTRDMLYVVMEQCKCAEVNDKFVQDVTCAPEPMAVLCSEQQLGDLTRFCCDPYEFCILGIDPTFNLGDFSVTPTAYRHLLVQNSMGNSPLMLGPLLVHYHKEFRNYNYFFSTLIGLKQENTSVKAIGTDGEKALVDAALRNFPQAAHVRCFRHLQQNIERHLREKQFPADTIREYNHDVFGSGGTYHEGLVDCPDISAFNSAIEALEERWNCLESVAFSDRKSHQPGFYSWFIQWKAEDFRHCTLRSLREDIGLGSPPKAFYTNDSESVNAMLKECLGYKKHQWALFNSKIKEMVHQQQQEVEKAIIGYGQYRLRPQFSFLAIAQEKWFRMTQEQRQRCIKKFNAATVHHVAESTVMSTAVNASSGINILTMNEPTCSLSLNTVDAATSLSVILAEAIEKIKLPYTTLEGIWRKATSLMSETNAVVPAPGFGEKDRMVKSKSGSAPHLIKVSDCQYQCDNQCPQFKSINICSHVVAAAERNGDLVSFVNWFCTRHSHGAPNLMKMAVHGMPPGAGHKGGKASRKRAKQKQVPSDENRVPLNIASPSLNIAKVPAELAKQPAQQNICTSSTDTSFQQSSQPSPSTSATFQQPTHHQSADFSDSWQYPPVHCLQQQLPSLYQPPLYPTYQSHQNQPSNLNHLLPYPSIPSTSLYPSQYSQHNSECFKVYFKFGNISICNGCRNSFDRSDEVVLQHAKYRYYTNPQTGLPASKYGNAYYHPRRNCIQLKWGPVYETVVPETIIGKLTFPQKQQLHQEFALVV